MSQDPTTGTYRIHFRFGGRQFQESLKTAVEKEAEGTRGRIDGEDRNQVRRRRGAENLAALRRLTLMLLKAHPSPDSIAKKRFAAALDSDFLEEVLRADGILENL